MRLLSLVLALLLVCTGCSSRPLTDIEPRQDYAAILRQFLPASSQMTILTDPSQDTYGLLELYELTDQLMEQFAITLSPSNNTPYALAIILPEAGQQETLLEKLQALVEQKQLVYRDYLPKEYAIAADAKLETMDTGEVVLAMCPDSDEVMEEIRQQLEDA
ncbi:MAG TPA: DUF4358 domain-containing protein [Candidatus Anaerofilum excrementigallinarum]|nr:DUF4358 domain-containing protein [Candidatus Anaerofilum excrementigallinarum]